MTKHLTLVEFLRSSEGKIISVDFIKRTTGEKRTMNCRFGVKKGITGAGMKYDPLEHGLIPVFDMQKKAFRMINLDTVLEIRMDGKVFDKDFLDALQGL